MYLADYHTHSRYSYDGCEDIIQMCEQALKAGLSEIAITDHVDIYRGLDYGYLKNFDVPQDQPPFEFGTPQDPAFEGYKGGSDGHFTVDIPGGQMQMPFGRLIIMDLKALYGEIAHAAERYEGRLKVRAGAELGQPLVNPEAGAAFTRDMPLDFVIGSIHNMDWDLDVYYYDFSRLDLYRVYDAYIDTLIETAKEADFDVLGHITYPLRYMYEREKVKIDLSRYTERFITLFDILKEKGRGIELNVSGLGRAMNDTMPPFDILKMYRQRGGEIITIGSDAHTLEHIGDFQKEAREMLRAAGFRYITVYEKRKPQFIRI